MRQAVLCFTLVAVVACTSDQAADKERRIVARVNGAAIYLDEFQREYRRLQLDDADGGLPSLATIQAQKAALLDSLIERRLLSALAEKHHVVVGIDEVEAAYQRLRSGWDEQELDALLTEKDMMPAELKRELRETLAIQRYLREHVYARLAVTDEEITAFVETHPEVQVAPEEVRAQQIVVKTEEKANDLLRQIKAGLPFEQAAINQSLSPEAKNGGDLGFFTRGSMPTIFDQVCFTLKIGEVSPVVASDYGFHLFKVIDRRPETLRPVDQVRQEVERRLRVEKEQAAHQAHVLELRAAATITVFDKELARVH